MSWLTYLDENENTRITNNIFDIILCLSKEKFALHTRFVLISTSTLYFQVTSIELVAIGYDILYLQFCCTRRKIKSAFNVVFVKISARGIDIWVLSEREGVVLSLVARHLPYWSQARVIQLRELVGSKAPFETHKTHGWSKSEFACKHSNVLNRSFWIDDVRFIISTGHWRDRKG